MGGVTEKILGYGTATPSWSWKNQLIKLLTG